VLALLELLQTYGRMSGPARSRRLGVGERTVRRYMILLADLGIPVEAGRGRHGGYRLRPGYKLPPLMCSEDEALALVLGLLVVRQSGLAGTPADVGGALGKVERVMPDALRARSRRTRGGCAHRRGARHAAGGDTHRRVERGGAPAAARPAALPHGAGRGDPGLVNY